MIMLKTNIESNIESNEDKCLMIFKFIGIIIVFSFLIAFNIILEG